uniref:Radical SAM superfamily protein n=1 Tax=viral metagenome TaxID=1070528 RepID=A0A6H1Z8B6_9ZZZZ
MIRVFPRKTKWTPDDDLAFIGDPPLFRPANQPVYISVVFTWDRIEGERLLRAWSQYYSDVLLGGPAFDSLALEFEPGQFIKQGVTITSRGCIRRCPWCFVPQREGQIREIKIKDGWIVQDNNLLACSMEHLEKVFEMLPEQKRGITFSGGLDSRLLNKQKVKLFKKIKIHELWFACDTVDMLKPLMKARELFDWVPQNKMRCYVLLGFDSEPIRNAEQRLETVYDMGFLPFAQLYQPEQRKVYSRDWLRLNRKWSRPAAYRKNLNPGPREHDPFPTEGGNK